MYFKFTEGTDYTAITGTVTLTPTDAQQCVTVMIEDDSLLEETESLTVSLSPTGVIESVQLSLQTTTIVITDDDGKKLEDTCTYIICVCTCVHVCTCICAFF